MSRKGVPFEEVDLDGNDAELTALRTRTGMRTVPQIFVGETFVGGFSELAALDARGELDRMLGR